MKDNGADKVIITDVTLREYGQNVPFKYLPIFSPEVRIKTILKLIDAGFTNIEVFSCVHPKSAPAMNTRALKKIAKGLVSCGLLSAKLQPRRVGSLEVDHHQGGEGRLDDTEEEEVLSRHDWHRHLQGVGKIQRLAVRSLRQQRLQSEHDCRAEGGAVQPDVPGNCRSNPSAPGSGC